MKKRVLLIDESLTVQKVVALTLDKSRYSVAYAKSRAEAMQYVAESPPNLIMVSDQVTDVSVASFPKEVEAWLGRHHKAPPILLITGQDIREMRHYAAVLKKPFSPQALQSLVTEHTQGADTQPAAPAAPPGRDFGEEQKLHARFHETFNDEAKLVRETFQQEIEEEERTLLTIPAPHVNEPPPPPQRPAPATRQASFAPPPPSAASSDDLWSPAPVAPPAPRPAASAPPPAAPEILRGTDNMAYKAALESQVESALERENLTEIVSRVLERLLPPIVERLVQERLDRLLKEQEDFVELKP